MIPKFFPFIDFKPSLLGWLHLFGKTAPGEAKYQVMKILGEDGLYLKNSLIVALCSSLITLVLGVMAGYALTRFQYRRWKNEDIAFFILSQRMFPPVALAMPFFILFNVLQLLDNVLSLIIVYSVMNLPIVTWIVKEFFSDLPKELEEAALVDGCSRWKALFTILMPLAIPGIAVSFLFSFIFSWNEFLIALTLTFENAKTLPLQMAGLTTLRGPQYWDIAASSLVIMIPPLLVTIFANRYIIRGLTFGAVKQ
ncbi:MAG: multiple sugar transport system permease protein [Candidatus Atribacteria bacterium]|nr:multiple sugar transport system permease protein [Candidatus Atribacteria bacterium]